MMQINRTGNDEIGPLQFSVPHDVAVRAGGGSGRSLSVDTDTAGYVHKALSCRRDLNVSLIEEARALLAGGHCDSPAAIRQAAANIISLGF
ncbi:MAG TPA: hypothetical protein VLH60_07220 [Sedimentisphaerales bacterium]|nr:hypothetical protein [Sedimentisphaerales bacterium]